MHKISLVKPLLKNILSQNPFPFFDDNLIFRILAINIYNKYLLLSLIFISGSIGIYINYFTGYIIYSKFVFAKNKKNMSIEIIERIRNIKYLIKNYFILFLSLYIYKVKMGAFVLLFISITGLSKNKKFYIITICFYAIYLIRRFNILF